MCRKTVKRMGCVMFPATTLGGHFAVLSLLLLSVIATNTECPRDRSRVVRRVLQDTLSPLYTALDLDIPRECPLSGQRDMYAVQEAGVFEESSSKWICQFCGKPFYEMRFLDLHFVNRHPDKMQTGSDVTCLADHCDVFRCDVRTGRQQPRYWDLALCQEGEMGRTQHACAALLEQCTPSDTDSVRRHKLLTGLNETLCDYLTCSRYWETESGQMDALSTSLYIIFGLFLLFGLCVYYYIVYTHFYTDESLLVSSGRRRSSVEESMYYRSQAQDARFRASTRYT